MCGPLYRSHLTKRCSEPRTVPIFSLKNMRTSFLTRAVADLMSRWADGGC